jgi:multiple sugar transport system ATP-binding protein
VASVDASSRLREGELADFWFPGDRIHLFDPATGENLTCDVQGSPSRQ